ncbi:hypothetical protein [Chamaesiphon sp. OTE_20_metabat_361]|uniref:hypothetical protein n=1 Tax=Chamaesiphon sp. OTE_20_metabat_361 TaxID=2964689 RepID=UPI00286BBA73|nr:hypothetical protein [Chamaesiphon sp. OTE_20_metabat_361]
MQVSLTLYADQLLQRMMSLGYRDPVQAIEIALERMVESEMNRDDSPEIIEWMRQEVAIGASQAEKGEFSTLSLGEIKAQVLVQHQQNLS